MKTISVAVLLLVISTMASLVFADPGKVWRRGNRLPQGGWVWPKLEKVYVYAKTDSDSEGHFNYSYTVYSSTKNTFTLYRFEVDLRDNPQEHPFTLEHVSSEHNLDAHGEMMDKALRIHPLKILRPEKWNRQFPGEWQQKFINDPIWTTTDGAYYYQLKPGEKVSGFGIVADFPPGIRDFSVAADVMDYFEAMPSLPPEKAYLANKLDELDIEMNKGATYSSKTIAPVAPPEPFTVSSWTIRMESDAVEARKLGWIKTDKTLAEIEKLIAGLKNNNPAECKSVVEKIERYVLSEKKKGNMTDEADSLVRLNAEYLLRRFEKPKVNK